MLEVIECDTAEQLLESLAPVSPHFRSPEPSRETILFRGCADATWRLIPSALRDAASRTLRHQVRIETDALGRAKTAVRAEARKNPGATPISAIRLAEADLVLFAMRSALDVTIAEYENLLLEDAPDAFSRFGFALRINNLKINASQQVVDVVSRAMLICGIAGYRNDSKLSLGRHLRDAIGAGLMVNNDRILGQNATMHIGLRD